MSLMILNIRNISEASWQRSAEWRLRLSCPVLNCINSLDAMTSGKTTVGSTTVGSTTVDSIPFGTIRQLCQYDSWVNSICLNTTVGSIPFVPIRQMYQFHLSQNNSWLNFHLSLHDSSLARNSFHKFHYLTEVIICSCHTVLYCTVWFCTVLYFTSLWLYIYIYHWYHHYYSLFIILY